MSYPMPIKILILIVSAFFLWLEIYTFIYIYEKRFYLTPGDVAGILSVLLLFIFWANIFYNTNRHIKYDNTAIIVTFFHFQIKKIYWEYIISIKNGKTSILRDFVQGNTLKIFDGRTTITIPEKMENFDLFYNFLCSKREARNG